MPVGSRQARYAMEAALALAMVALCAALGGCSLFRSSKTPQQKFAEALMRGNSMQASQLWLNMSPEDRLKFARGQGISANPKADEEAKRQILNHYQNELSGGGAGSGGEEVQQQIPTPLGASIQQLPGLSGQPPAAAPPANPQGN
jgi:hypothetical protein